MVHHGVGWASFHEVKSAGEWCARGAMEMTRLCSITNLVTYQSVSDRQERPFHRSMCIARPTFWKNGERAKIMHIFMKDGSWKKD